jgi:hypothetical protein
MASCTRCDKPIDEGRKYCSRACAHDDRCDWNRERCIRALAMRRERPRPTIAAIGRAFGVGRARVFQMIEFAERLELTA